MEIKINGIKYEIQDKKKLVYCNKVYDGLIDYDCKTIEIKNDLSGERSKAVIMHECMHGLLYSIGESEFFQEIHSNEFLVENLSRRFINFVRKNKELTEMLRGDYKEIKKIKMDLIYEIKEEEYLSNDLYVLGAELDLNKMILSIEKGKSDEAKMVYIMQYVAYILLDEIGENELADLSGNIYFRNELGERLLRFIRDNKDLINWIEKEEEK